MTTARALTCLVLAALAAPPKRSLPAPSLTAADIDKVSQIVAYSHAQAESDIASARENLKRVRGHKPRNQKAITSAADRLRAAQASRPLRLPVLEGRIGGFGLIGWDGGYVRVQQVLGPDRALVERGSSGATYILEHNTSGWVDDRQIGFGMHDAFEVTRSETYTTVLGAARTVLVLRRVDSAVTAAAVDVLRGDYTLSDLRRAAASQPAASP